MSKINIKDYVTSAEAAKLVNKSAVMIAKLCQAGKLPGAEKIAKTWMIPRDSVLSYVSEPRGRKPKNLNKEKA
jgi:hypothetical protein